MSLFQDKLFLLSTLTNGRSINKTSWKDDVTERPNKVVPTPSYNWGKLECHECNVNSKNIRFANINDRDHVLQPCLIFTFLSCKSLDYYEWVENEIIVWRLARKIEFLY